MTVALVHDSFTQLGGAERVVEALHEMFPQAPVFTLVFDRKLKAHYRAWDIRTSWLQVIYNFMPKFQWLFPIIPFAIGYLKFDGYDLVISSSSGFAKNITVPKNCLHINYCHTPTRFLWQSGDYVRQEVPALLLPAAKLIITWLKKWDYRGAQRVRYFIANSREVQTRISRYYKRASTIIEPFVNLDFWHQTREKEDYFLLAGRLQAHKNNQPVIEVFNQLGLPLHVVGAGRQEKYLKSIAKSNISFLGKVSDERLRDEYSGATGFIFPQLEDFGLMPLEAAACGTASLAYGQGGALETVVPGQTGELFGVDNTGDLSLNNHNKLDNYKDQLRQLILSWNPEKYSAAVLRSQAEKFCEEKFKTSFFAFIETVKHENCH